MTTWTPELTLYAREQLAELRGMKGPFKLGYAYDSNHSCTKYLYVNEAREILPPLNPRRTA